MTESMRIYFELYRKASLLKYKKRVTLTINSPISLADRYDLLNIINDKINLAVSDCYVGIINQKDLENEIDTLMVIVNSLDKAVIK